MPLLIKHLQADENVVGRIYPFFLWSSFSFVWVWLFFSLPSSHTYRFDACRATTQSVNAGKCLMLICLLQLHTYAALGIEGMLSVKDDGKPRYWRSWLSHQMSRALTLSGVVSGSQNSTFRNIWNPC
jgi:hypothetical protein